MNQLKPLGTVSSLRSLVLDFRWNRALVDVSGLAALQGLRALQTLDVNFEKCRALQLPVVGPPEAPVVRGLDGIGLCVF